MSTARPKVRTKPSFTFDERSLEAIESVIALSDPAVRDSFLSILDVLGISYLYLSHDPEKKLSSVVRRVQP